MVEDAAGRFSTEVQARAQPQVITHTGYVQIKSDVGAQELVHCFVYDRALDAGQAATRLLQAAEVGISYDEVRVAKVAWVGRAPVVSLEAEYTSTDKTIEERKVLSIALSPRAEFPVVCSHEDAPGERRMETFMTDFLIHMTPEGGFERAGAAPGDQPLASEQWVLMHAGKPVGFSLWRAIRVPSGAISSLQVSATFVGKEATLTTTDTVVAEIEDAVGLRTSRILHVDGTTPTVATVLERTDSRAGGETLYRITGEHAGLKVATDFTSTEPLKSSYFALRSFAQEQPLASAALTYFQYSPWENAVSATLVRRSVSRPGEVLLEKGKSVLAVELNELGLPKALRGAGEGNESLLVGRQLFTKDLPAPQNTTGADSAEPAPEE